MASVGTDTFISSLTALKQLLHQQQRSQRLTSPNRSDDTNVDENSLQKKLRDAAMIIENERSLRKSLEKAFDELTTNRKLLQEELEKAQQKLNNENDMEVNSSSADWDKERVPLIKKIIELQEEARKVALEHEKYVQEQKQLESTRIDHIDKFQKQLDSAETDNKKKGTENAEIRDELVSLRKDVSNVIATVSNALTNSDGVVDSDLAEAVRILVTKLQESQTDKEKLEGALSEAKKETERLEDALAQFQPNLEEDASCMKDKAKGSVDNDIVPTKEDQNTEMLVEHEDTFGDEVSPEEAKERQLLKQEVFSLRRALKDAIGEASKSHGILDSLETKLKQRKALVAYCEKHKQMNDGEKRMSHDHIDIAIEKSCQQLQQQQEQQQLQQSEKETGNMDKNANEDLNQEDLKNDLHETRQLLEQNKKLVTILQNKIQKYETASSSKDEQIRAMTIELRQRQDETMRYQEQVRYFESLHTNNRDEEDDEDEEEEDDDVDNDEEDDDDNDMNEEQDGDNANAVNDDSDNEQNDGDGQEGGAQSVEIIDVSDDDDEDDDDVDSNDEEVDGRQDNAEEEGDNDEDDDDDGEEADQDDLQQDAADVPVAATNVVEQSEDDEATEEPSPKKQRVGAHADDAANSVVMHRDEDNDNENASALA